MRRLVLLLVAVPTWAGVNSTHSAHRATARTSMLPTGAVPAAVALGRAAPPEIAAEALQRTFSLRGLPRRNRRRRTASAKSASAPKPARRRRPNNDVVIPLKTASGRHRVAVQPHHQAPAREPLHCARSGYAAATLCAGCQPAGAQSVRSKQRMTFIAARRFDLGNRFRLRERDAASPGLIVTRGDPATAHWLPDAPPIGLDRVSGSLHPLRSRYSRCRPSPASAFCADGRRIHR